jgi:uncharacterized protein DUF2845
MLRGVPLPLLALAGLALVAPAAAEDSVRCPGGIVAVGDSKIDLLGKCGLPALQEPGPEERVVYDRAFGQRLSSTVERWTYNFGPNHFVIFVTMEAGKIVSVERGGYGYVLDSPAAPPIPRARCDHAVLRTGMSTFDVLALCGEPALRDLRVEAIPLNAGQGVLMVSTVTAEIWTYDFGPQSFVRFLEFVDGKLVKIETGSYGYAR